MEEEILKNITSIKYILATICVYTIISDIFVPRCLEIILIDPEKRKRAIKCSECGLSYSAKDYKVLYDNKKLIFFKFRRISQSQDLQKPSAIAA